MSTSILESAPTSNYFLRSHFVRSIGRPLDRSAARSFVRSFVRWMRLVRSRKYTSNGPYGHTVRLFSGEACRVHPRHRWVAGPLVSLVGGPAGRPEGSSWPTGRRSKGGASLLYPLFDLLFLLLCSDLLSSRRAAGLVTRICFASSLHTGVDGTDNDPLFPNTFFYHAPFLPLVPQMLGRAHSNILSLAEYEFNKFTHLTYY